jgi:hypothetical protein
MKRVFSLPWLVLAVALAGCGHPNSADFTQLQKFQSSDDRTIAAATITCDAVDSVCSRLYLYQGAACEKLSDQGGPPMRSCAVRAFRESVALLPANAPNQDRLDAMRGLTNALKVTRDNSMTQADGDQASADLAKLLPELASIPGGAPYAAYFGADASVNHVLATGAKGPEACAALRSAEASLPAASVPPDLGSRVSSLRQIIDQRLRSCT